MTDALALGQAVPASSGSVPTAAEQPVDVSSLVERFHHPPAVTPTAFFQLVGKDFHSFVSAQSVQLGRHSKLAAGTPLPGAVSAPPFPMPVAPAAPSGPGGAASTAPPSSAPDASSSSQQQLPTVGISLGDSHTISRAHMHLGWNASARRWEARALGKNGFWLGRTKFIPLDCDPATGAGVLTGGAVAVAKPCPLPNDQASLLRIGLGQEATMFYFVPALQPDASGSAANAGGAQQPKKKRRKPDAAATGGSGGGGAGGGGSGAEKEPKQKRRKHSTALSGAVISSISAIDDDAPLSLLITPAASARANAGPVP